jgi:hypothetical protein
MLLVDTVEERANMTMLAESTPGKLQGVGGALHILTSKQRVQRRAAFYPANRFAAARFYLARSPDATGLDFGEQDAAYVLVPRLSTVAALGQEVPASR